VPADQVTAAARASTCAYSTVASKFATNYRVDKIEEGSSRSCSIIATILEPTIFLAPLPGKRQRWVIAGRWMDGFGGRMGV